MKAYTASEINRLVKLPASLRDSLAKAGHIPAQQSHETITYSFQDVLVMRTAAALLAARIPPKKITAALSKIREVLPAGVSLTALSVAPAGKSVVIRGGDTQWDSSSGQYALPFIVDHRPIGVTALRRRAHSERRRLSAAEHFARAFALEDSDVEAARAGYLAALEAHEDHLEARINLGRLLHLNGELAAAETLYRTTKHASAILSFNLASLLEDMHREDEAVQAYRAALALDPSMADAHFNLSRLHERAERPREALQHLLAYRRHRIRDQK